MFCLLLRCLCWLIIRDSVRPGQVVARCCARVIASYSLLVVAVGYKFHVVLFFYLRVGFGSPQMLWTLARHAAATPAARHLYWRWRVTRATFGFDARQRWRCAWRRAGHPVLERYFYTLLLLITIYTLPPAYSLPFARFHLYLPCGPSRSCLNISCSFGRRAAPAARSLRLLFAAFLPPRARAYALVLDVRVLMVGVFVAFLPVTHNMPRCSATVDILPPRTTPAARCLPRFAAITSCSRWRVSLPPPAVCCCVFLNNAYTPAPRTACQPLLRAPYCSTAACITPRTPRLRALPIRTSRRWNSFCYRGMRFTVYFRARLYPLRHSVLVPCCRLILRLPARAATPGAACHYLRLVLRAASWLRWFGTAAVRWCAACRRCAFCCKQEG